MPVTTQIAQPETVTVTGEFAGRVRGSREVEVRARVSGILERRLYNEGAVVEEGAELFQIEPAIYEIALQQAQAELTNAIADRNQAAREWQRVAALFERNAISARERDRDRSALELAEARVKSAEAHVAEAQLNLDYTIVRAPISGATGMETLSEGSLIERGELLTTLTQLDPVQVRFALPETDAALRRSPESLAHEVRLVLPDGSVYDREGVVDFTDSTVDASTGTVSTRAVFENPDSALTPGQFVRIRVPLEVLQDVFPIDPSAVSQGGQGPRVFLVHDGSTVEARQVTLGPLVDGRQIVVDGLSTGDVIVVDGHVALRDGMPVAANHPTSE